MIFRDRQNCIIIYISSSSSSRSSWSRTNFVVGVDVLGAEELGAQGGLAHTGGSEQQDSGKYSSDSDDNRYRRAEHWYWLILAKIGGSWWISQSIYDYWSPDHLYWTNCNVRIFLPGAVSSHHTECLDIIDIVAFQHADIFIFMDIVPCWYHADSFWYFRHRPLPLWW